MIEPHEGSGVRRDQPGSAECRRVIEPQGGQELSRSLRVNLGQVIEPPGDMVHFRAPVDACEALEVFHGAPFDRSCQRTANMPLYWR